MSLKIPYSVIYILKKIKLYEFSKKIYRKHFLYSGILKNDIESILFYRSNLVKNGLFLDVGCFKGSKIDQFLNINKKLKIIGIEPFKKYFNKLVYKYKNFHNIEIYNYAITNKVKNKTKFFFNQKKTDKEAFSLIKNKKLDKFIYVSTCKIDDFISKKPKIIKIDTEGSEVTVIKGSKKTIKTFRPIFFIEVTNLTLDKVLQEFKSNKYLVYVYEFTFFKKKLNNDWITKNLYQSNLFDKKIYKSKNILSKKYNRYMFNIICFPKENENMFKDLYDQ